MRIRLPLLFISALIAICLVSSVTQSQTRHRPTTKQKNTKTQQLLPLTLEQKQVAADLIEQAKSVELTYQTEPSQYAIAAETFMYALGAEMERFPAGPIKTHLVAMAYGYRDAGVLWGMLTGTSITNSFYEAQAATTGKDRRPQLIEEIGRRWRINVMQMGLNQAQRKIFNNASHLKDKLISLLVRTPTSEVTSSTESNEWTFPKLGMKGEYSDLTKTTMYDLGQGFFAGHIELAPGAPAVAMFLSVPIPKEEVSDVDLALVFASKAVKLSKLLTDTMLEKEKDSEYRFRTASGKILIVALNSNREMAILRFE